MSIYLPKPDEIGVYRYKDGAKICPVRTPGLTAYSAHWANGSVLRGDNDEKSYFKSPQDAAQCLFDGREGPWHEKASAEAQDERRRMVDKLNNEGLVEILLDLEKRVVSLEEED